MLLTKFNQSIFLTMEFIDDPQFGHKKNKLPVFMVPILMFAILLLGIFASKLYVDSVLYPTDEDSQIELKYSQFCSVEQ